jgi:hypothetical protein
MRDLKEEKEGAKKRASRFLRCNQLLFLSILFLSILPWTSKHFRKLDQLRELDANFIFVKKGKRLFKEELEIGKTSSKKKISQAAERLQMEINSTFNEEMLAMMGSDSKRKQGIAIEGPGNDIMMNRMERQEARKKMIQEKPKESFGSTLAKGEKKLPLIQREIERLRVEKEKEKEREMRENGKIAKQWVIKCDSMVAS